MAFVDEAGVRDYVEIKISDNGSGIAKEDLPRIYSNHFTAQKVRKEQDSVLL